MSDLDLVLQALTALQEALQALAARVKKLENAQKAAAVASSGLTLKKRR